MKYWYSRNAKLCLRADYSYYQSSSAYYPRITNGENFKNTSGNSFPYLFPYLSSYDSGGSYAQKNAMANGFSYVKVPASSSTFTVKYALDDDYDDAKYNITNEVTGLTYGFSATYPGSTVITVTNSTAESKTINAILYFADVNMSTQNNNYGSRYTMLVAGILFEEDVTIAPGGTYTVTLTV